MGSRRGRRRVISIDKALHTIANPAGRLLVFRVFPPFTDETGARGAIDLRAAIVALSAPAIIFTDLRHAQTFSPATTERFVGLMKADNPKIERSVVLLCNDAPMLALQITRVIREAENPNRAAFIVARELAEWCEPVLSEAERAALAIALEPQPAHSPTR